MAGGLAALERGVDGPVRGEANDGSCLRRGEETAPGDLMPVTLQRIVETSQGTLGQFSLEDNSTLYTMERQSFGEHPRIPAGLYEMRLGTYNKGGYPAYEVIVPGRSEIKIHAANLASE